MKAELQERLYKKYPILFTQHTWKMTETCMNWGICTGDGWYKIIDECCKNIMKLVKFGKINCPQFIQVKEKFGTLRLYLDWTNNRTNNIVEKAYKKSSKTCENCGQPAMLKKNDGWLEVLCKKCKKKQEKKDNAN